MTLCNWLAIYFFPWLTLFQNIEKFGAKKYFTDHQTAKKNLVNCCHEKRFFWSILFLNKLHQRQFQVNFKSIPYNVKTNSKGRQKLLNRTLLILSGHQLIFCTRKISKIKRGKYKHIKFRSFKHYSADLFKETLTSKNFPNYQNFSDATEAYDDLIQKLMVAIDKVAPIKERRIKHYSQK